MMAERGRRAFLKNGILGVGGLGVLEVADRACAASSERSLSRASEPAPGFKLGLVTYNLAKDWDIETLIKNCEETGFDAVELRTTHKHGVELPLTKEQRAEVRRRFENSRVRLLSLGTTCEYHSPDLAGLEKNMEETRRWCELAHDLGCLGVKVRPNGFAGGIPHAKTLEQIGRALAKCGNTARDLGVEIWLEVHGPETQRPPNIHRIMEVCNHPAVGVCWNSNDTDVANGSVKQSFDLLRPWLRHCHINELWRKEYPWRELFGLLKAAGYNRYTLAEIPSSCEPIRLMHYYRALWKYLAA